MLTVLMMQGTFKILMPKLLADNCEPVKFGRNGEASRWSSYARDRVAMLSSRGEMQCAVKT